MKPVWMVRAGRGGKNIEAFLQNGIVAMGGERLGALSPGMTKGDLLRRYAERYPEYSDGHRAGFSSQLLRFLNEVRPGDRVITYDREQRAYAWGEVSSGYEWKPGLADGAPNLRRVDWTHRVLRDDLSATTRNSLGAIQTFFRLGDDAAAEMEAARAPAGSEPVAPSANVAPEASDESVDTDEDLRAEILEKSDEFIEDRIARLSWDQMQHLVAGILRAMGYRTTVSAPGPDRGVDIFASPDGLGLQEPRIFVEVKHRTASMGAQQIRAFLGGRKPGDRCLYVSTGGFTRDAHYEAERASVPISLVSLPALRKLLLEHYEGLDAETRALVPLKRLYWPVD